MQYVTYRLANEENDRTTEQTVARNTVNGQRSSCIMIKPPPDVDHPNRVRRLAFDRFNIIGGCTHCVNSGVD